MSRSTTGLRAGVLIMAIEPEGGLAAVPARQAQPGPPAVLANLVPAGFWRRLGASAVDAILLAGVLAVQSLAILSLTVIGMTIAAPNASNIQLPAGQILIAVAIVQVIVSWLYSALLTSSAWRATLGKRLASLEVTDLRGDPISFARATAIGELAGVPGWLLHDADEQEAAHRLNVEALHRSRLAGDGARSC